MKIVFDCLLMEGIEGAIGILNLPQDQWDIGICWGIPQVMATEVLVAAAGRPAKSAECHYLVEFGISNASNVDKATHKQMLRVVDQVTEKIKNEPEALDLDDEGAKLFLAAGERMRERVSLIEPAAKAIVTLPKGTIRDPETGRLRDIQTGELL